MCHDKKEFEKEMMGKHPILFKYLSEGTSPEMPLYKWGINVKSGWFDLLRTLSNRLENYINKTGEEVHILDIKEKMGGLRVHVDQDNEELQTLILGAELRSMSVCEYCGSRGTLYIINLWCKTVCQKCFERIKQKKGGFNELD